jgi:hypothetical protein
MKPLVIGLLALLVIILIAGIYYAYSISSSTSGASTSGASTSGASTNGASTNGAASSTPSLTGATIAGTTPVSTTASTTTAVSSTPTFTSSTSSPTTMPISSTTTTTTPSGVTSAPAQTSTYVAPTPTYTTWSGMGANGSTYAACSGTITPGYCILPLAQAVAKCNSDPNCGGYGQAANNSGWMTANQGGYQLFGTNYTLGPNSDWVVNVKN